MATDANADAALDGHTAPVARSRPYSGALRPLRKPRPASPLIARKQPKFSTNISNRQGGTSSVPGAQSAESTLEALRREHGGWSRAPPDGVQTFPVFTTKRSLREGYRYHVARFVRARVIEEDKPIDPSDQEEFARPVTLHRRDPRQPPPGRVNRVDSQPHPQAPVSDEEAEKLAHAKAERDARRAIDQAKIAPVAKDTTVASGGLSKAKRPKEEKTTINRAPKTEEGRRESDLRYEEALPWHLEDADGKNIWVGNYVSALSKANNAIANVAFVIDRPGFRMIPLEKWYKFTSKPPFTPYSLDQAEALMSQKGDISRWAMRYQERQHANKEWADTRNFLRGPAPIKSGSQVFPGVTRSERIEHDEIDMSGDEFQDDDEAPTMEALENEDEKDVKARVRRDQLGANLFGEGDEQKVDREEQERLREIQNLKKLSKNVKKALVRREHDTRYQSNSSGDDPFDSSTDDASSSDEACLDDKTEGDAPKLDPNPREKERVANVTSRVSGTAVFRQKQSDSTKITKSLKRPSSPTLSDSSGNESTRKKAKGTSATNSRSMTPISSSSRALAGSGLSDGLGTATGSADIDDTNSPPTKRMRLGAENGDTFSTTQTRSPKTDAHSSTAHAGLRPIEAWEIVSQLPPLPGGTSITTLMKSFQSRVGDNPGQTSKRDWIRLVTANTVYGVDKLLRRKPAPS